jgi:hypothetical protein
LVIDTAAAAVLPSWSKSAPRANAKRKDASPGYFFFFFAGFFFAPPFLPFFAFMVLVLPLKFARIGFGQCQCENFQTNAQTDFSTDGYREFR